MPTEIKVWQIIDEQLEPVETNMTDKGRREKDLEKWIKNNPSILGQDILIIGEQVQTKTGAIDFLGIDKTGNPIIVELKRDKLPREVLAQTIDYASAVAHWDTDKLSEICREFTNTSLEEYLSDKFGDDVDLENLVLNETQRILLVGFSIEEPLQRMIEWLSDRYGVSINALILKYVKTKNGDELLSRIAMVPEEIEKERTRKRKIRFPTSDDPGDYEEAELKIRLKSYLSREGKVPQRIREVLLPLCLKNEKVSREMIKKELVDRGESEDEGKAGIRLTAISRVIGFERNDYLRQIIQYDKPNPWEKDNYRLVERYKDLVKNVLDELAMEKEGY